MKLYYSPTSPYARKCRALVIEKGLEEKIEMVEAIPFDNPEELHGANPLGKVPALTRDGAAALIDSPLICEFIDTLNDERWVPESGGPRWAVLRQQAIADGLIDITIGRRIELWRDEKLHYDFWIDRWGEAVKRTVAVLEHERGQFERSFDLGALSVAISLGYLDLRYPDYDWRADAPGLAEFYARWAARESMQRTEPPAQ